MQLSDLIFSTHYHKQDSADTKYIKRYANSEELEYYVNIALDGLDERENLRLANVLDNYISTPKSFLVVGCGTGREVFALKKSFEYSYGIDTCLPMIIKAKETQKNIKSEKNIEFTHIDKISDYSVNNFDLIYLTVTLMNHMKGRNNRILFYRDLSQRLSNNGIICGFSNILPLTKTHHFYWISQLLRLKSFISGETWEQGDSIRNYLGSHTTLNYPIFYHFDQSQEEILKELEEAGLSGKFIYKDFWLAQRVVS